MRLLKARRHRGTILLRVWLDDTKTLERSAAPDPAYVATFEWGADPPPRVSAAQYLEAIRRETRALAIERLRAMTEAPEADGTALPGEGDSF